MVMKSLCVVIGSMHSWDLRLKAPINCTATNLLYFGKTL